MEITIDDNAKKYMIYEDSIDHIEDMQVFMANFGLEDFVIASKGLGFEGEVFHHQGVEMIKAKLNHKNANNLRKLFPYTAPRPVLHNRRTFGLGDRLGNATPGHIQTIRKFDGIMPVLAQQSVRELNLTNRTFSSVLDDVSFSVFRCGYRGGYGADGDHLKTETEVEHALESGFTMVTLDCSEYIRNEIYSLDDSQLEELYSPDPSLEKVYLNKAVQIGGGVSLYFDRMEFMRMLLIYSDAIDFAKSIFEKFFSTTEPNLDFEISIDETLYPTTPNQHYFVANELKRRGVQFASLAPRFCGDFQKGIEYIGDLDQFETEFKYHALIADSLNYKISVHSGSDKFSVYPIVKKLTKGKFHIKTSGTSWLEAMKTISKSNPAFFRTIHKFAFDNYEEALKYYHVTSDFTKIPDIKNLPDEELPVLFNNEAERQLIHICYGLILNYKDQRGHHVFREKLYHTWKANEDLYFEKLEAHIGKHLGLLQ